jgi:hypothetical protein
MNKFIVYEYTEYASPQYQGTRFMTLWTGVINPNADPEQLPVIRRLKVVAKDITEEEAYALIRQTEEKNIEAHLSEYPEELRTPESDEFIRNLIHNGNKGNI